MELTVESILFVFFFFLKKKRKLKKIITIFFVTFLYSGKGFPRNKLLKNHEKALVSFMGIINSVNFIVMYRSLERKLELRIKSRLNKLSPLIFVKHQIV